MPEQAKNLEYKLKLLKTGEWLLTDPWSDYEEGVARYWYFDPEQKSFICEEIDTVVGSFHHKKSISSTMMQNVLAGLIKEELVPRNKGE